MVYGRPQSGHANASLAIRWLQSLSSNLGTHAEQLFVQRASIRPCGKPLLSVVTRKGSSAHDPSLNPRRAGDGGRRVG